jgi:Kdo2-lipid IVA lauroyltransferase/acyltransferase
MNKLTYCFVIFFVWLIYLMPFRLLYCFSDFLYFIFFYIVKYRKKVVFQNLRNSFPEKSEKEIRTIAKKFYKHLCDILLESIKGFKLSKKQILKRHRLINPDFLNSYFERGQSVIVATAHYSNWEWGSLSGGLQTKFRLIGFYKPLSNNYVDELLKRSRAKCGMNLITIFETFKTFQKSKDEIFAYILASDQSPSNYKKAFWVNFLNQETACLHGIEKYAKLFNYPVLYIHIYRIKRGYYEIEIKKIIDNPTEYMEGEITKSYMELLEKIIKENPYEWLWSHRRWKKTRKEIILQTP